MAKTENPTVISYSRWSSPEQSKGDTQRRQNEAAEQWAGARGLTLSPIRDPGISAYRGKNISPTAALGRFLEAVKRKEVRAGTILLVESLDRLSRQSVLPAVNLFTSIIEAGVKVVTLCDNKEYDAASVTANPMDLMFSIMIFSRANEESKTKGERVSKAWRNKQLNAKKKIVTSLCPQWMERDGDKWKLIPAAAAAIRLAAKLALNGFTWRHIIGELNEKYPKTVGIKNAWTKPILLTLFRKRTLIGEYQPKQRNDHAAAATAVGEAINDYYPAVLDAKTFRAIQNLLESRKNGGGTRLGEMVNIWSGRMYDMEDRKIHISNHGSGKRYKSSARVNGESDMPMSPVFAIDQGLVFGLINHLKLQEVQTGTGQADEHYSQLESVEHHIEKLKATLVKMESDPAIVVDAIDKLQIQRDALKKQIDSIESSPAKDVVLSALASVKDIEDEDTRRRLKVAIASIVDKVHVYFVREWRDHIISAVVHLNDGSEVDVAFRLCYEKSNQFAIEWQIPQPE